MKRGLKKALKVSGIVLGAVVFLLVAAILVAVFDKPLVRSIILKQLNKTAGTTARMGRLDYSVFPFRVTVAGLDLGRKDAFQELGLSLPRFEAHGSILRILRGAKPAFDVLEAEGLDVRLTQKAVSEAPLNVEKLLLQASDAFAWTRRIALKDAKLDIALLTGRTVVEHLDLVLTPGPGKDTISYEIGRADLNAADKSGAPLLAAGLSSSGRLGLVSPFVVDTSFGLEKARFAFGGSEHTLDRVSLAVAGRFDRSAQELTVSRLSLTVPGLFGLEGKAAGRLGHGLFVEAEAGAKLESLAAAATLAKPLLPASLRDSPWAGRAELNGKYLVQRTDLGTKDNVTATLVIEGVELTPQVSGAPLPVRASGRFDIAGPTADPRVSADLKASLGRAAISGLSLASMDLHLVASGSRTDAEVTQLEAGLAGLAYNAGPGRRIALDKTALTVRGRFDLTGRQGVLTSLDANLSGLLVDVAAGQRIALDKTTLTMAGSFDQAHGQGVLTSLDVRLAGLAVDVSAGRRVALDQAAFTVAGSYDMAHYEGVLKSLEARLPGLTPVRLSGRYGFRPGAPAELKADIKGLDLPALRKIAGPFLPADLAAWDLGGSLDLALAANRPFGLQSDWGFTGTVSLPGLKFNDPSFTIAGDSLNPVLKIEGAGSPAKGFSVTGGLDLGQGESLWKAIYVPWSKYPLKLTASARYDPASGAIDGLAARIVLPEVGSIDVKGMARISPAPSFDLAAEASFSLGPLYSLYSQAGTAGRARTKLEGSLGATLVLRKTPEALTIGGRVKLAGANVEPAGSQTLLLGIAADVPILYDSRPAPSAPDSPPPLTEEGRFHIGELQSPFLNVKPIDIALRAGPNALAIEPLSLPLFGGRLDLGRTTFRLDPATGALRGLGSLALKDIDISQFPIQSPQFKLTGKVQADFPRLDIGTDKIAIEGRGVANVFGGQIVLRDLAVTSPFAPGRAISLDIDILDLDMKKVTDEVPFGEVTGIVRGEVRGLVITYGQPESFNFRIESVPRKGVKQTFSLKAVDNLTVLSSGQKASGGTSSFWMKFVRGFRYQKLGIVSTLRNDTFTLNGTIHEGGTEYLMKKPALFGISVVNREPGKKISFKEMASRLKRVGQPG